MSIGIRVAVRGLLGPKRVFEDVLTIPMAETVSIAAEQAKKHCSGLISGAIDMIELEFLDEPNSDERFFRFGTNPAGMVRPTAVLPMWTVYYSPIDYPGKFVVRRSVVGAPGVVVDKEPLIVCDSLDAAQAVIPEGAYCLRRMEDDEPQVIEVWL